MYIYYYADILNVFPHYGCQVMPHLSLLSPHFKIFCPQFTGVRFNLYSSCILLSRTAFKYLRAASGSNVPYDRTATASAI